MASEVPAKRAKSTLRCIIHCTDDNSRLISPQTVESWQTLSRAAELRQHTEILDISQNTLEGEIPVGVFYHRKCRSMFTMKRDLEKIESNKSQEVHTEGDGTRKSIRNVATNRTSRVLEKECIFCEKKDKYLKGSKSRENLTQACELRVDQAIRKAAEMKKDERVLAILSRELVAAEAHYHRSCYRMYTKVMNRPNIESSSDDIYACAEVRAFCNLFEFIRNSMFVHQSVVELSKLTDMLVGWMKESGINDIKLSTKKHIRRKIESEFGDSLHMVQTKSQKVLIYPDNLTRDQLVVANNELETEVNSLKCSASSGGITEAAHTLHRAVKDQLVAQSWPPNPDEVDIKHIQTPALLTTFLHNVLNGDESALTQRMSSLMSSVSQDLVYGITRGRYKPAKHILLPFAVKSLTGNAELIQILNRLGHGVSYSQLEEIETSLCLQKIAMLPDAGVALPGNIYSYVDTILGFDNIDRLEGTLSGGGTSHRVNGIAVQPVVYGPHPQKVMAVVSKEKQRSVKVIGETLPVYNAGQRVGPPSRKVIDINAIEFVQEARKKDLLFVVARLHGMRNQQVCSWTGFNILVHDKVEIVENNIGYLPTINAPATNMSTVNEILNQSMSIMHSLHLSDITCVFDQAIYCKAAEIKWKHGRKFESIVLRLGTFHTLCTMLSIIGKRFQDAGLKDLCIESTIIAEGSVSSVLEGRNYNRAMRLHKLVSEAFMRVAWEGFQPWVEHLHSDKSDAIKEALEAVGEFVKDINKESHDAIMQLPAYKELSALFAEYLDHLREENGPLSSFWMSYIDMVEIMLCMIRASREGDWMLHLSTVRQMLPWCFAYDAINYSRYMSVYYSDMISLPEEHPLIFKYMKVGGFSVQMSSGNPFGRIPVDQTVEETVNKDTQIPGGTKGFSLKPGAVQRYYLTAEYRTTFLRNLRELAGYAKGKLDHADLHSSRITKDEADVEAMVDLVKNNWTNPFSSEQELVSISTGVVAPTDIARDIARAHQVGEKAYQEFKTERLEAEIPTVKFHDRLAKQKLKTFTNINKTKKVMKGQTTETVLRADRKLFAHMVIMAQSRQLHMQDVLKHPLGPLPWALATGDGMLRKTNKAQLGRELEKLVQPANNIPRPSACLIDGMALVQKLKVDHMTFGEIANIALSRVLCEGAESRRIDVVFDEYRDLSIKGAERLKRGEGSAIQFKNLAAGHKVKQFRSFLKNGSNKNHLIKFFVKQWSEESSREKLDNKVMYVTNGSQCMRLTADSVELEEDLTSSQEEADTRLLLHAKHMSRFSYEAIIISSEDTDVRILCLAYTSSIQVPMFQKCVSQSRTRYIEISKMANALGQEVCNALPGMHAFTGCDTVSAFAGMGKMKPLKMVRANKEYQAMFQQLGAQWSLSDELLRQLQSFVCAMYGAKNGTTEVNKYRYEMFCAKNGEAESHQLPPCEDCLGNHCERANYQTAIWKNCLENHDVPSPVGKGWILDKDGDEEVLEIDWMKGPPAPQAVIELMSCKCKRSCKSNTCVCIQNGVKCSDLCKLTTCTNQADDADVFDLIVEDDPDSDSEDM